MNINEKLTAHLIERASNGDYGLLETVINAMSFRLISKVIPQHLLKEFAPHLIGQELYVVVKRYNCGKEKSVGYMDELEAIAEVRISNGDSFVKQCRLYRTTIEGGNPVDGWEFSIDGLTPIYS